MNSQSYTNTADHSQCLSGFLWNVLVKSFETLLLLDWIHSAQANHFSAATDAAICHYMYTRAYRYCRDGLNHYLLHLHLWREQLPREWELGPDEPNHKWRILQKTYLPKWFQLLHLVSKALINIPPETNLFSKSASSNSFLTQYLCSGYSLILAAYCK